ncbi:hypothetical protein Y1Q_0020430 [Alligator mississippiensis]|uniref:Uncharacterized protein n=1 Tax=Alligator mississippiensis TaxID=8496 RepID=A0A151N6R2_ALLMI|nr:hypothetical protein Y1Q_0020430 [Alligator mississippiensis]
MCPENIHLDANKQCNPPHGSRLHDGPWPAVGKETCRLNLAGLRVITSSGFGTVFLYEMVYSTGSYQVAG